MLAAHFGGMSSGAASDREEPQGREALPQRHGRRPDAVAAAADRERPGDYILYSLPAAGALSHERGLHEEQQLAVAASSPPQQPAGAGVYARNKKRPQQDLPSAASLALQLPWTERDALQRLARA